MVSVDAESLEIKVERQTALLVGNLTTLKEREVPDTTAATVALVKDLTEDVLQTFKNGHEHLVLHRRVVMAHKSERQRSQKPGFLLDGDESFGELDFGALATGFLLRLRLLGRFVHFACC